MFIRQQKKRLENGILDMPKYGCLRTDGDHWYLLPEGLKESFGVLSNKIYEENNETIKDALIDAFIDVFDKYRLSGGYQDLKILMEE
jgi:hypothetical protein